MSLSQGRNVLLEVPITSVGDALPASEGGADRPVPDRLRSAQVDRRQQEGGRASSRVGCDGCAGGSIPGQACEIASA